MTPRQYANVIVERSDFKRLCRRFGKRRFLFWRIPLDVPTDVVTRMVARLEDDPSVGSTWETWQRTGTMEAGGSSEVRFAAEQSYGFGWLVWIQLAVLVFRIWKLLRQP